MSVFISFIEIEQVVRPQQPLLIPVHSVAGAQERRRSKRSQVTTVNNVDYYFPFYEIFTEMIKC